MSEHRQKIKHCASHKKMTAYFPILANMSDCCFFTNDSFTIGLLIDTIYSDTPPSYHPYSLTASNTAQNSASLKLSPNHHI